MASTSATNPDTLVSLKINQDGANRKFKVPLRDLGANTLPDKLRYLLAIPPTSEAIFERYSDSAAAFVVLDPNNASVYKQLYRAAKAKLKLRLKVTIKDQEQAIPTTKDEPERVLPKPATVEDEEPSAVIEAEQPTYSSPPPSTLNECVPGHTINQVRSVAELSRGLEELVLRNSRCSPSATSSKSSSGIAQKQSSQSSTEIPVTRGPAAREKWFADIASVAHLRQNPIRNHTDVPAPIEIFAVHCNNCNDKIPDGHYHCSICDDGDFDLCESCVKDGVVCKGEGHWMIKRFVKNGKVINSTTETVAPKAAPKAAQFSESKVTLVAPEEPEYLDAARTCNSCIQEFPEDKFVTCTTCDDYDLCIPCHVNMEHGHNPKHAFAPAVEDTHLDELAKELLAPGRNTSHNAICDGCDKYVYGVRHKCLDCPDWDFCSTCIVNSSFIHPGHRFVPIYEPLYDMAAVSGYATKARHQGIYCDGPLCNANSGVQSYIKGDRYKCAVCHDTDFCANCEASPSNQHNKTHPLIKFRTPVRLANITTIGEHGDGTAMPVMGDRHRGRTTSKATETTPTASANAATQVQTVADLQPSESKAEDVKPTIKVEEKQEVKTEEVKELSVPAAKEELVAYFVRDAVRDGTTFTPNSVFEQTWYLRNGGNSAWPAGCSVKFTGGDNMCANDPDHPASVHELVSAAESTTCYTEVAPGQEAGFTVLMRTPKQPGNAMSYWRLTGPDGTKFGPRMWCDINVEVPTPVIKEEPIKEPVAEHSQMIFPKLEKESPTTSIHEETVEHPETKSQSDLDEFEDFVDEPLDEETDDGFLTDEEYDILDASDEEYLVEQAKAARK